MDKLGMILCSRYSYGPNSFHYCGPDLQNDLTGYVKQNTADPGLAQILNRFETLYPYLTFIASQNNIKDPFDRRVVEAYWLGNNLLRNIKTAAFADHLSDGLVLKKRLPAKSYIATMDRMVTGGMPQHTYHVLNIFMRTGHHAIKHTLSTMDNCRISWGKVTAAEPGNHFVVSARPLVFDHDNIHLGESRNKTVVSVSVAPNIGDYVSLHWGFICDILTSRERLNLAFYTKQALQLANHFHALAG